MKEPELGFWQSPVICDSFESLDIVRSQLENSYLHCEQLARRSGSNFVVAFRTLPRDMFRQMCVLYAFMRQTDDLGDDENYSLALRQSRLQAWRQELTAALQGNFGTSPILPALADLARVKQIPAADLLEVIRGVEGDLTPRMFATFQDLEQYCYQVAGVVGLCCLKIWGDPGPAARESAIACGTAFQLTNILRDLKEDAQQGRVYLPVCDFKEFGYSIADLRSGQRNGSFQELMEFQVARARKYYLAATPLMDQLSPPGRRILLAFFDLYSSLLQQIERSDFDVLSRRIRLSRWKKASVALRCWLGLECRNFQYTQQQQVHPSSEHEA